MPIKLDPTRPIYLQIMEEIKKRSVRGVYASGEKLPSVREMAREMEVNPNTIARVYRELEREGFIFTRRGQGSFITEDSVSIEEERTRLGHAITGRFVDDVSELEMTDDQVREMLKTLNQKLLKKKRQK